MKFSVIFTPFVAGLWCAKSGPEGDFVRKQTQGCWKPSRSVKFLLLLYCIIKVSLSCGGNSFNCCSPKTLMTHICPCLTEGDFVVECSVVDIFFWILHLCHFEHVLFSIATFNGLPSLFCHFRFPYRMSNSC